jgi:predicted ATPase/DNA-binding CsgD family transcriptional regulator
MRRAYVPNRVKPMSTIMIGDSVQRVYLPAPASTFVGRQTEIREIVDLLHNPTCRLLTLVGPGGIGKTRLALEAARQVDQAAFPHGIYFVNLTPLENPYEIIPALIEALPLQLQEDGSDPFEQLLEYMACKQMLVVLDNFEHLLPGAEKLQLLMDFAAEVKFLVTSRVAINLQEEWIRTLTGLAYPENGHREQADRYAAVQLFLDRARRLRRDFKLEAEQDAITHICQLVQGMPLAIELAAGWLNTLTLADIAAEIEHGLDILVARSRNVAERHRSMRVVFAHSWTLLSPEEQAVFMRLSVFRCGFDRTAAAAIAGATLPVLASLVDKSLIVLGRDGRYSLHELLRQYAAEQLDDAGAIEATHDTHMAYYLTQLSDLTPAIKGQGQIDALDAVGRDFENIRAAWYRAVKHRALDLLDRAYDALNLYADMRTRYTEGEQLFRFAVETLAADPAPERGGSTHRLLLTRLQMRYIRLLLMGGITADFDVQAGIDACRAIVAEAGTPLDRGYATYLAGIMMVIGAPPPETITTFQTARAEFAAAGDDFYVGEAMVWEANMHVQANDYDQGFALFQECLAQREQSGEANGIAWVLLNLGESMLHRYRFAEAEDYFQQAYTAMQRIGTVKGLVMTGLQIVTLQSLRGDGEAALTLLEELASVVQDTYLDGDFFVDGVRSVFLAIAEDYDRARALAERGRAIPQRPFHSIKDTSVYWGLNLAACGQGDFATVRQNHRNLFWPGHYAEVRAATVSLTTEAAALAAEGDYHEAAELLGKVFSLPDAVTRWLDDWPLVTRLRQQISRALGSSAYEAALTRGAARDLASLIRRLATGTTVDARAAANATLPDPLTDRELEVLELIAAGLSNRAIAEELVISVGTVKVHNRHIYDKLGADSRTQAIALATDLGLV